MVFSAGPDDEEGSACFLGPPADISSHAVPFNVLCTFPPPALYTMYPPIIIRNNVMAL